MVRLFADQIRSFVPMTYSVLGTDGFGRSDTRAMVHDFVASRGLTVRNADVMVVLHPLSEAQALSTGMQEKSAQFVAQGAQVYRAT